MELTISLGNKRTDKIWTQTSYSLEQFEARISTTIRTAETVAEYKKLEKSKQDNIKDVGGFVLGKLDKGRRKKDAVLSRSALTLDMDFATPGIMDEVELFFSFFAYFYSTHKHTKEHPRLRLILPLSREVSAEEYQAVARKVAEDIGMELFDDTTYEPSRLMYWPSTSQDGEFVFKKLEGDFLNPDTVLARYQNWKDTTEWPVSSRQNKLLERAIAKQADPLGKSGLIGAFNRTYTITEAIEKFLGDVYKPSSIPGRFDYIHATTSAGVVLYDDKFAYSHHATDPYGHRLLSAFDLVRLHLFGDQDDEEKKDSAKQPSYKAMQDYVLKDDATRETLAKERLADATLEFADTENWQASLELDKTGRVKDTLSNIATILHFDPNLQNIVYNEFKNVIDVIGEVPWRRSRSGWNDSDLANAKLYFERVYGIWSPTKFKDALLAVVTSYRLYHPIKEYLEPLVWDGVERIDSLLIVYLGAKDTAYTRAVMRKTMVAAIARIYEPGIKFDSILVLNGPQGIGKSTFFLKLGKEWFSDSLAISDMRDKTAAEKLQGYWILEISEMTGIRKTDVETVKSFISRQDDKFRQAYGVNVESHPRTCIIVGSTNSEGGFLRDVTGNRRFWPIRVSDASQLKPWELVDVDQLWAEAKVYYEAGEELFLKGKAENEANKERQEAMESDDREGIVAEYLDTLLPDNWAKMDLYERRTFLAGSDFGSQTLKGTEQRERVCIMEIWCECFGKERQNIKKADSYEIEGILNKIGGWNKYTGNTTGKMKFSLYGTQRAFVRVP